MTTSDHDPILLEDDNTYDPETITKEQAMAAFDEGMYQLNHLHYKYEDDDDEEGTPDLEPVFQCFLKSAQLGFKQAQYNVGIMYMHGEGVEENFTEGLKWIKRAARQNEPMAMNLLGMVYRDGVGVETDLEQALSLFSKASDLDFPGAQYNMGGNAGTGPWYRKRPGTSRLLVRKGSISGPYNDSIQFWYDAA